MVSTRRQIDAETESIVTVGASVSIVQAKLAGLASRLPAWSLARTSKVWLPSARPLYCFGEVQAARHPASSRHSNEATPEPLSLPEKPKEAALRPERSAGWAVIWVSGAVVSIVQVKLAGLASRLPA